MTTRPLIDYFEKHLPLSEEEKSFVEDVFRERKIKRRQFILREGDISKYNSFVVEGCFRMYLVDEKGKEHNLQFAIENWWIGDIGSFHSEEPSKLNIEALENSIILQIKKDDQLKLFPPLLVFPPPCRCWCFHQQLKRRKKEISNCYRNTEELHGRQGYPIPISIRTDSGSALKKLGFKK